jgi:hypothetical protein
MKLDPKSNSDYRRWLEKPPEYFEGLGESHDLRLRQMVSPLTDAQLEQTIANTITRMPRSSERAEAFARGLRRGYASKTANQ